MPENVTLKGMAVGMFGSIRNFADSIGWSYSRTYRVLNGKQEMTVSELKQILEALNVTSDTAIAHAVLFFS